MTLDSNKLLKFRERSTMDKHTVHYTQDLAVTLAPSISPTPHAPRASPIPSTGNIPYRLPMLEHKRYRKQQPIEFPAHMLGAIQIHQRVTGRRSEMIHPKFNEAMIAPIPHERTGYHLTHRGPPSRFTQRVTAPATVMGHHHNSAFNPHVGLTDQHPILRQVYSSVSVYRSRKPRSHGPFSPQLKRTCHPPHNWLLKTYGRSKTIV